MIFNLLVQHMRVKKGQKDKDKIFILIKFGKRQSLGQLHRQDPEFLV